MPLVLEFLICFGDDEMSRTEWLRKRFTACVAQGMGRWTDGSEDSQLGRGIYIYDVGTKVQIFEAGLMYGDGALRKIQYDKMTGLVMLNLVALMHAQKVPDQPVELTIETSAEVHVLLFPL